MGLDQEKQQLAELTARRRAELGLNEDGTSADDTPAPVSTAISPDRLEEAMRRSAEHRAEREARDAREAEAFAEVLDFERAARWGRLIPGRFVDAHVDQLDGVFGQLAGWDGTSNVLLVGNVGAGKTHAAVALARTVHDQGGTVGFWPVVELLDALRPAGDPRAMDRTVAVDVLVLDDLGLERPSDWTFERLYAVVNRRWLERRPTIVTSNLSAGELERSAGAPMWSRLYHDAIRVVAGGEDRRKANA